MKRTRLRTKKPLRRYTLLRQVSAKRAAQSPAGGSASPVAARSRGKSSRILPDAVAVVKERSGGPCEAGLAGCWGRATEMHHRITRKLGGRHGAARRSSDRASNLLHLDAYCHLVLTQNPDLARSWGLSLREWQEPTSEPVLYRGEMSYLDDAGGVHDYETAGG